MTIAITISLRIYYLSRISTQSCAFSPYL